MVERLGMAWPKAPGCSLRMELGESPFCGWWYLILDSRIGLVELCRGGE